MTHEQRLHVLGLTTFDTRMIRADLVQVLKILILIVFIRISFYFCIEW